MRGTVGQTVGGKPTNSPRAVTALMKGRQGNYESSLESLASSSAEITMNIGKEAGQVGDAETRNRRQGNEQGEHRPGEERYRNLFYE